MRVLVIEDDPRLGKFLERLFREEGHVPVVCATLRSAEEQLASSAFDVVILDRMLPDGDGLDLCARLRNREPPLSVLLLSARGEVRDRVGGLQAGADDYLTKPFEVEELLARVDAVRRRVTWITRIGPLEIDRRSQLVRLEGNRLTLTSREYGLLARLADAPDTCVSRRTLLSDVWNIDFDPGSGVIDVHVSRLREKLGRSAWMIETIRRQGLRLRTAPIKPAVTT